MARKPSRAVLLPTPEQVVTLKELAASRTAPLREVERAKMLLGHAGGTTCSGVSTNAARLDFLAMNASIKSCE